MITRQTSEATPLSVALFAAACWLKRKPGLQADPELLLEFTCAWIAAVKPSTPEQARECGIAAVKEIAGCRTDCPLPEPEVIEPEDLNH